MKLFPKSLPGQILAGLIAFSLTPLTVVGFMAYSSGRQSIVHHVQTHLESVAILKEQAIGRWSQHLQHSLMWLTRDPRLLKDAKVLSRAPISSPDQRAALVSMADEFNRLISLKDLSLISFIDITTGQVMVSSDPSWVGKFRDKESFFTLGRHGHYTSDIFVSLSMGQPTMVVSGPIIDPQGKTLGIVAAHANLDRLNTIMGERTGLSQTTETFLVNKSNLLITPTVFAPAGAFKKWIFGEGAQRAIAGENGVDLFMDYRDVLVIGAYRWLPDRKLALIVKQDAAEAFGPATFLGTQIAIVGLAVSFFVILISLIFAKQLTTPLKQLVQGAQTIGQGNLNFRLDIKGPDEITLLSKAFDQMAENLKTTMISLDEKEILLREIHHRVKNNLQMIQSLLNLQMNKTENLSCLGPLQDSKNRISSIALVHNTLYHSKDLSTIDLDQYFQELVNNLANISRPIDSHITLDYEIQQLPLSLDAVIACGLITNELVTNALKYAFPCNRKGEIIIKLIQWDKTQALLMVSDNGVGMPVDTNPRKTATLGLELVHILSESQLEGTLNCDMTKGVTYSIHFPLTQKAEPHG